MVAPRKLAGATWKRESNDDPSVPIANEMAAWSADEGRCMLKVLIVEDDLMIADVAEEVLGDSGYDVCGIARTVAEAVELGLLHKPDLAVIDVKLADGGLGTDIPALLSAVGRIGILYATGNTAKVMLGGIDGDACISKPYSTVDLVRGLKIVADIVATGSASQPFPHGLQLLPRAYAEREAS
jgi:CheY-like chemotaxis protein